MKKKLLKGEIATIITLGTLIILGVSSLISVVFLKKTQTTKTKAAGCSQVSSVSYSGNVAAGQTFTCSAVTDGASPYTMACGISKNGGWPYGMQSGSCSGGNCTFSVKMDDQIEAGAVYDLVAFDFRTECGPNTGNKITLNVSGAQPQPTQANCDQECCGKPDGFIYQQAIKERCDSNYKGGRYVIIDGVCQGGKKTEKPGCATCKTCQAGAPDVSPVPGADLAVNECTSSCEQNGGGICSGLPDCPANITPAIVRSCNDASFSCTSGYTACKKDGAIWCYGSGSSGGGGNPTPTPKCAKCVKKESSLKTTPPPGGGTPVISPTSGASAPNPTYTPTPTPFCQNINIPQINTGINVGLANENGAGQTVSIDDIVNGLIRYRIRMELSGAKTIEEIRFRMDRFISDAILQGIGQALSNLSQQIAQTNFMYIKINDILIPTPVYIIQKEINIVGVILNNSGIVASLVNNLSHRFVDSVINNICQ